MAVFAMTKFNYRTVMTANAMAGLNIPIINFKSNLVDNFVKGSLSLLSGTEVGIPTISIDYLPESWAFVQHISIFSCSKFLFKLFETFIKFTKLLSKLLVWGFHFILHFKHHCYSLREKCPYSELHWFRIFLYILRKSPYSVRMRENTDQNNSEYGHFLRSD